MGRGVTNEPLTKAAFERIFKKVLEQSGYFGSVTVHAIRRCLGRKVDENYTAVERSQHLTQSDPRVFGDKYVANTSSVDGERAFLHEAAQHDHVDYFQSFAKFCERGLPTILPAAQSAAVRQDPQLLALTDRVSQLTKENAPASDLKTAKSKAHSCHSKLIKKALKEHQFEWVKNRRDSKILTRGKVQSDTGIQPDLLHTMSLIFPERRRLAQAMIAKEKASDEERRQIRKDLYSLISRDYLVVYLPGEEPADGFCPVATCGVEISSLRKDRRSTHVHACRHKERAFRLERLPAEVKYCYLCFGWIVEEDWDEHCQFHLQRLTSMRCGSFTYCSTLVRPAFCPFCVGNSRLDASRRLSSWIRDRQLRDHLEAHLQETSWPGRCPFPLCDLEFVDEGPFLYHLSDVYYLKIGPSTDVYKQKRDNESRIIHWEPPATIRKRKREDGEVAEMQIVSPHMLSKVPLSDDGLSDLPDLIYSGSASPPDNEESCSFTFRDMPETESDKNRICSTDETLFSLYLRSRSPSCSPENGTIEGATTSGFSPSSDIGVLEIADAGCAQPTQDAIEPEINQPEIKKPRIILRVRPPKTKARSKTTIQPKEPQKLPQKHSSKRSKSKPKSKPIPKIRLRLGKLSQRT